MRFFETKYRVVYKGGFYHIQEHRWWDLIYGWWWSAGVASSLDEAKKTIRDFKTPKPKGKVVHVE